MITAAMVKELRVRTGVGMMDCKKALAEANGDMDKAVDILRELLQSMKASGRTQEAAAIDFALDTMKFRYVWISDPVEM